MVHGWSVCQAVGYAPHTQTHCIATHRHTHLNPSMTSLLGWWMVHTTVRPVARVLRTARITMPAARASRPARTQGRGAGDRLCL